MASPSQSRLGRARRKSSLISSTGLLRSPSSQSMKGKNVNNNAAMTKTPKLQDIADKPCLAFTVLSEGQTNELLAISSPDELESKLCEHMKVADIAVDIRQSAVLDFYVLVFHWAKSRQFTPQQVSGMFTLCHTLLENVKEKHLSRAENMKELKKLLAGVGLESPEVSGGLDFFTVDETRQILQHLSKSLFQHYSLYEYVFSTERREEILGIDLEIETAKSASVPWPPPLDESISEEAYNRYVRTPSPAPEEPPEAPAEVSEDQEREEEAIAEQLSPEQIQNILDSVCREMLEGFEGEVASKLREREIAFINRINKIHKVAETT